MAETRVTASRDIFNSLVLDQGRGTKAGRLSYFGEWCQLTERPLNGRVAGMEKVTYTVNIEADEEGGFVATVPALPGCMTQGETYEETLQNAEECIEDFLVALTKADEPIPTESQTSPISPVGIRVNAPATA